MLTTLKATTRVAYTGAVNEEMTFGLSSSEYVIKNIDGLGPVKASLTSADNASDPGSVFLSARDGQRNIVITMGFAPSYSTGSNVTALRQALKSFLMPKTLVELRFTDDVLGVFDIWGHVETHEPVMFSKEPEVVISIICDDPYFYKNAADIVFNIPTLTPGNEEFSVDYAGDVPVGFIFEFDITSNSSSPNNYVQLSMNPDWADQPMMRLDKPFLTGQHYIISSQRGNRKAEHSAVNDMLYFSGSLTGMLLYPGLNYFGLFPVMVGTGAQAKNAKLTYKQVTGGL